MRFFLLSLFFIFGSHLVSFSQQDSVYIETEVILVSSSNSPVPTWKLKATIHLTSLAYTGAASLDLYLREGEDNRYLRSILLNKEEIVNQFTSENTLVLTFEHLPINQSYKLETTLQNQDFFYYPPIVNIINP